MTAQLLSDEALNAVNIVSIVVAALSAGLALAVCSVAFCFYRQDRYKPIFAALPTRMLYIALILSIPFSIFWIFSCAATTASIDPLCQLSMWGIVYFWHMINGLLCVVLIDCAVVIHYGTSLTRTYGRITTAALVTAALAFSLAGIWKERYGYLPDIQSCWFRDSDGSAADDSAASDAFAFEMAVLLGPTYFILLIELGVFILILFRLIKSFRRGSEASSKTGSSGTTQSQTRLNRLIFRLSASPALLFLHSLMIIGADLPIEYSHASAQFASFFFGYLGFAALGLFLVICAVFIDVALARAFMLWREPAHMYVDV